MNSGIARNLATCLLLSLSFAGYADPNFGPGAKDSSRAVQGFTADLGINFTAPLNPVPINTIYRYDLAYNNAGPSVALTAVVLFTHPAFLVFDSSTLPPNWVVDFPTIGAVSVTHPGLASGDSGTLSLSFFAPGMAQTISVDASISSGGIDPVSSNNAASNSTTFFAPFSDLSLIKLDSADPVFGGTSFDYILNVTNAGPDEARNVIIDDTLPAGLTLNGTPSGANWDCGIRRRGGVVNRGPTIVGCGYLLPLPAGVSAPPVVISVTAPSPTNTIIVNNTAVVSSDSADTNTANDSGFQATTVNPAPIVDLAITKIDSRDPVIGGTSFDYIISLQNLGGSTATGIVVTDNLPSTPVAVTFAAFSGANWSCTVVGGQSLSCSYASGLVGGAAASDLIISVDAPNVTGDVTVTNTATVSSVEMDSNSANNLASEDTLIQPEPGPDVDISVTKTAPDSIVLGTEFSYTIVVENTGPDAATSAFFSDELPLSLDFVSLVSPPGWACSGPSGGSREARCDFGELGGTFLGAQSFDLHVIANTPGDISNTALGGTLSAESNNVNNRSSVTTLIVDPAQPMADLQVIKVASESTVAGGAAYFYTVTVTNLGPNPATNVIANDTLPPELTLTSITAPDWECTQGNDVVCTLNQVLASGDSSSFAIDVLAPDTNGVISNAVSVSADETDPVPSNNTSVAEVTVAAGTVDLELTKTASSDNVEAGASFRYTLSVMNHGSQSSGTITVDDALPNGVSLVAAAGTGWDCTVGSQTLSCVLGDGLAPQFESSIVVDVQAGTNAGATVNTATVSSPDTDANPDDNTDTASVTINAPVYADLQISKTDMADPVVAGAEISYLLEVTNLGPAQATGVVITDVLPAEVVFVSAAGSGWTCGESGGSVSCTLDSALGAQQSSMVTVVVQAPAQSTTVSNTASVMAAQNDPVPGNNQDSETTEVDGSADPNALHDGLHDLLGDNGNPIPLDAVDPVVGACARENPERSALCDELVDAVEEEDRGRAERILTALAPTEVGSMGRAVLQGERSHFRNVDARLAENRAGGGGFISMNGLNVVYGDQYFPVSLMQYLLDDGDEDDSTLGGLLSPWGFFMNGTISLGDKDSTSREVSFDFNIRGLTAGIDYRFSPRFIVGGAVGLSNYNSDFGQGGGLDTRSLALTLYSSYYPTDRFYVDGRVSSTNVDLDQTRVININEGALVVNQKAISETTADQITSAFSMGYHYSSNAWSITPSVSVKYVNADVGSFSETGAGANNVRYDSFSVSSLQWATAISVSKVFSLSKGILTPQFDFSINQETRNDALAIEARFLDAPTSEFFLIRSDEPDKKFGNIGVGLVYVSTGGKQFYFSYRKLLGLEAIDQATFNFGLRFEL